MNAMQGISAVNSLQLANPASVLQDATPATSFQELLSQTWNETQGLNADAVSAVENSLMGDDLSMVESFTAIREADISLRLMMQIRNKLLDAYQELQQIRF